MSILSTSPTNTRMFDAEIAAALGNINAAVIVQQLNYWINKDGVGTTINGVKYVYNTFVEWVNQQFPWLSVWQFRKAMSLLRSLGIVKVIRYKAKQWNQTNYYSLDCDRLAEFLSRKNAEARPAHGELGSPSFLATSTETVELCDSSPQDDNSQSLEVRDTKLSLYRTENTHKEKQHSKSAATSQTKRKKESGSVKPKCERVKLSASLGKESENKSSTKQDISKETGSVVIERSFNNKWKQQIQDLDSAGIPVNKTLITLLKTYKSGEVENAIALFKTRKREHHIPNPAGYFSEALKGNWARESAVSSDSSNVDKATLFRHWYDLARELGYCSGQKVQDEEQWVCLSGAWERWKDAVERGYSVDYLLKIIKRSGR